MKFSTTPKDKDSTTRSKLVQIFNNFLIIFPVVPVIKEKPKVIKIIKKKTVIIECIVVSKFEPKCTWFKETNEINETERHSVDIKKIKEGEFTVKLEISQVNDSDKGSYKLVAKNERGEAMSQIVEITEIPEDDKKEKGVRPQISKKLTDQDCEEGKSVGLFISLKQVDKKVKITWYKENSVIKETSEMTTTFDGTTARLSITKSKKEHTGNYRVTVTNEFGDDESSSKIVVVKKEEMIKKKKQEEEEKIKKQIEEEAEEAKKDPFAVKLKHTETKKSELEVRFFFFPFSYMYNNVNKCLL